jgi:hypothetical protein
MKKLDQNGSHLIVIVLAIFIVGVVGFAGWRVLGKDKTGNATSTSQQSSSSSQSSSASNVTWEWGGDKWSATGGTPQACPNPLALEQSPADISKATSILYPGQTRGGDYKSHGGFRFDGLKNGDVTVRAPMGAKLVKGSRYVESGETQYFFVFINPCGIMYRLDHLLTLSEKFQSIADKLPQPKVDDSRTTNFDPMPSVEAGEVIATAVGFQKTSNVGFDFGVNDLRAPNAASKNSSWAQRHEQTKEYDYYGICWFDLLPSADVSIVKSLPAGDGQSGKNSDYCK